MTVNVVTLELSRESMCFSAGHFMIFSETEREYIHGHNYQLTAHFTFPLPENGVSFDCQHYINLLNALCNRFNRVFLLPTESKYLTIETTDEYYHVSFVQDKFSLLKKDVVLLPLRNISMEELVHFLLAEFIRDQKDLLTQHAIQQIQFKLFSQPGIGVSANCKLK
jgi:6-pyruvoyltetrahydropterin/6-carboxytetrahydropterin synthase